ncbi:MAG: hypothetical protein H0U57_12100, partial [Tatlockia sp.]|nr:hypothetical protein [Tatlockia sp.]
MKNKTLDKLIKKARESFSLPLEITSTKTQLSNKHCAYVFKPIAFGEPGRVLIIPHSNGESQFSVEVSEDPDDPMTIKRKEILNLSIEENTSLTDLYLSINPNNYGENFWATRPCYENKTPKKVLLALEQILERNINRKISSL